MKKNGLVDNYMIFTNRKYTGIKGDELSEKIKDETGILNSAIIGKETIPSNRQKACWSKYYPSTLIIVPPLVGPNVGVMVASSEYDL